MAKRCAVTGKGVLVGHNVSHANNKTKRRFLPNLQEASVWSDVLERSVRLRLSVNGLRSVEHKGGIDAYLQAACGVCLSVEARRLKRQIVTALVRRQTSTAG